MVTANMELYLVIVFTTQKVMIRNNAATSTCPTSNDFLAFLPTPIIDNNLARLVPVASAGTLNPYKGPLRVL